MTKMAEANAAKTRTGVKIDQGADGEHGKNSPPAKPYVDPAEEAMSHNPNPSPPIVVNPN